MENLFINIITVEDFKSYQQGWSENFEDNQIQDAINIATNDLNAFTNFLLEKVYVYNTGSDVQKNNPLYRNEMEMKALTMSVLSQTYYKLMNGNDNSIGDASFSGAGVSISQSLPERNYIAPDVYQWLINARLLSENKHNECDKVKCVELGMDPLELAKKPYPDPIYVPSKWDIYTPYSLLQLDQNGYVNLVAREALGFAMKEDITRLDGLILAMGYVIKTKADDNLTNVNVGEKHSGKVLGVDPKGFIQYVDGGVVNYINIINKPQINGVELIGNKKSADLSLASASDITTINTNITTIQGDVSTLKTDVATAQTDITTINTTLANKADTDLTNVNVGTTHSGKLLEVDTDGTIKYVEPSAGGYYAEQDLSNVNVGTENAGKNLSVATDGSIEYTEGSSGGSGIVFEKQVEMTNAYQGTSTTQTGVNAFIRTDGVNWDADPDLEPYLNYISYKKYAIRVLPPSYTSFIVYLGGNIQAITTSAVSNLSKGWIRIGMYGEDGYNFYNQIFYPSFNERELSPTFVAPNGLKINSNQIFMDLMNTSSFTGVTQGSVDVGGKYGITNISYANSSNIAVDVAPKTYNFTLQIIKI